MNSAEIVYGDDDVHDRIEEEDPNRQQSSMKKFDGFDERLAAGSQNTYYQINEEFKGMITQSAHGSRRR